MEEEEEEEAPRKEHIISNGVSRKINVKLERLMFKLIHGEDVCWDLQRNVVSLLVVMRSAVSKESKEMAHNKGNDPLSRLIPVGR